MTGIRPVVVLSDEPSGSKKIAEFAASEDRWMVAVRMVSEGVDIPRLAVGVYATSVSTALYFAQAVGRFVRARRRGETASVFLPSIPVLLGYAAELEAERDHVLGRRNDDDPEAELAEAQRQRDTPDTFDEPRSSRCRRRRTSTGPSTTGASSARPPRRRNSSACRACWPPTRSRCCCAPGRPAAPPARKRGQAAGPVPAQAAPLQAAVPPQAAGRLRPARHRPRGKRWPRCARN